MASDLDGGLVDNLTVLSFVAMLCAGILGIVSSGGEAVASLGVLEFVVVHYCYYLLCSLCLYYNTSLIVCQEFFLFIYSFFLLSEHLYHGAVSCLDSYTIDGDVGVSTTRCIHGTFIGDQMPTFSDLACFPTYSEVVSCVSSHCLFLHVSLFCNCIIAHHTSFVNRQIAQNK